MKKHLGSGELQRYFGLLLLEDCPEEEMDFCMEIEAHLAECRQCMLMANTFELLLKGVQRSAHAARRLPHTVLQLRFTRAKQVLIDWMDTALQPAAYPVANVLAAARGAKSEAKENDLSMYSYCFSLEEGSDFIARAQVIPGTENAALLITGASLHDVTLLHDGQIVAFDERYDDALEEYTRSFPLVMDGNYELQLGRQSFTAPISV